MRGVVIQPNVAVFIDSDQFLINRFLNSNRVAFVIYLSCVHNVYKYLAAAPVNVVSKAIIPILQCVGNVLEVDSLFLSELRNLFICLQWLDMEILQFHFMNPIHPNLTTLMVSPNWPQMSSLQCPHHCRNNDREIGATHSGEMSQSTAAHRLG